jgi:hypothetical protein
MKLNSLNGGNQREYEQVSDHYRGVNTLPQGARWTATLQVSRRHFFDDVGTLSEGQVSAAGDSASLCDCSAAFCNRILTKTWVPCVIFDRRANFSLARLRALFVGFPTHLIVLEPEFYFLASDRNTFATSSKPASPMVE